MPARLTLFAAAIAMALAVALGAFGAHALKARLAADALAVWQTAVQYHAWHALGLLGIGLWQRQAPEPRALRVASLLLAAGIVLFSGSLYALALTGVRGLGAVTPFGGVAFIAGWLALAKAALDVNDRRSGP
ncbi:MAG: DUF423 domain-containing protein [Betaproteobacteria bacterium]|nr:DUF423 domain-containing protein [Betaproteobacteria bacterium]